MDQNQRDAVAARAAEADKQAVQVEAERKAVVNTATTFDSGKQVNRRSGVERRVAPATATAPVLFPSYRYHATESPKLVNSAGESDELGDGWSDVPVDGNIPAAAEHRLSAERLAEIKAEAEAKADAEAKAESFPERAAAAKAKAEADAAKAKAEAEAKARNVQ